MKKGILKTYNFFDIKALLMLIVIGIECLILFIGSTAAVFIESKSSKDQEMYETGDLSVTFAEDTENTITLTNQYPISDEAGKKQTPYTFRITNNGTYNVAYTIQIIDKIADLKNVVKYQINGSSPKLLSTGNTLDIGTLMPGETKSFNLRLWIDSKASETSKDLTYQGTISVSGQATLVPYFKDNSGANTPELAEGMIPVVYDGTKDLWVVADQEKGWYNYSDQVWANAVTVSDAALRSAKPGTELPMDKINSMWVWIPKYKYKLFNTTGGKKEQEISIVFDEGCQILGDVNLDGEITEEDYEEVVNYISGKEIEYTEEELLQRADMNNDGSMTSPDWMTIQNTVNGLEQKVCIDRITTPKEETNQGTVSCTQGTNKEICQDKNGMIVDGISTYTHPAFTFGEEELTGFWAGKFETSVDSNVKTDNSNVCYSSRTAENCNTSNLTPTIKPDVVSLRFQQVSNQFLTSLKFANGTMDESSGVVTFSTNANNVYGLNVTSNTTNTHMMKNTEWAAVAYLSQSRVGKYGNGNYEGANKEIYINNSTYFIGRSGGAPGSEDLSSSYGGTYSYNDKSCEGQKCTGEKTPDLGTGASTTGTIYGIYDMSGGSSEYVMGNWDGYSGRDESSNSGFNGPNSDGTTTGISFPEDKYYDKYTGTSSIYITKEKMKLGDATWETKNWYLDNENFTYANNPWFIRGVNYNSVYSAGIFSSYYNPGYAVSNISFRTVLVP